MSTREKPRWPAPIDRALDWTTDRAIDALVWIDRHQIKIGGGALGAALVFDAPVMAIAGATLALEGQIKRQGERTRRHMRRAATPPGGQSARWIVASEPDIVKRQRYNEGKVQ